MAATTKTTSSSATANPSDHQDPFALAGGRTLDEHENPGEATVHVLHGRVRLSAGHTSRDGNTGDLRTVPAARHSLEAVADSAVLLTVAKLAAPRQTPSDPGLLG
jgi:quercetin dioxygenase-like cupin family protein